MLGLAAGLALAKLRRNTLLPLAIAVLNGVAFVVFGIAGLSLLGRYLFLASTMLALFAAVGRAGLDGAAEEDARYRRRWAAGGVLMIVGFLTLTPWQVDRLLDLRSDIADRDRVAADLHEIADQPAVARAAKALLAALCPQPPARARPGAVDRHPAEGHRRAAGGPVARRHLHRARHARVRGAVGARPARPEAARRALPPGEGPPNWERELGRNASWVAFSAGCAG